jgi:hypothetical protein
MDLTTLITLVVAGLIVASGYFLFNDMPRLGRASRRRQ